MNNSEALGKVKTVRFSESVTVFTFEKDNICLQEYLQLHHNCLREHLQRCYFQKNNTLQNFDICKELEKHFIQQMIDELDLEKDPIYQKKIICSRDEDSSDEDTSDESDKEDN